MQILLEKKLYKVLYQKLYENNLIFSEIGFDYEYARNYAHLYFQAQTINPEEVIKEIKNEIDYYIQNGVDEEDFLRIKNKIYGEFVKDYNDVSTLIHEAGHSMHTTHSKENNDFLYYGYKIFVAEVASTVNETLFDYYMLEKAETNEEKKFIISEMMDSFKATLYRQTMFAEFEQLIYNAYENGTILTSEFLCSEYLKLNQKYFGKCVNVNEEIKYEWARIPHFFYNFYVYQYATGISAAYYIVNRIRNNEENAVCDYLKFLKAGDSVDPIDALKLAGVDMTSPDVVNGAIDMFDKLIDMFNELKQKLVIKSE